MIATIALDDGLILPHSANPTGSNFRERQEKELLVRADKLVGDADAVLVIGDIAIPKKGTHSVAAELSRVCE
jgi:hypothetical protein